MQDVQFKIIFRGWIKNRTYTLISLVSLISGITCCTLLITFVLHEYRIAHSILNEKNCYLVQTQRKQQNILNDVVTSGAIVVQLKNTYPEVENLCVLGARIFFSPKKPKKQNTETPIPLRLVLQTFSNSPYCQGIYVRHSRLLMKLQLPDLLLANISELPILSDNRSC